MFFKVFKKIVYGFCCKFLYRVEYINKPKKLLDDSHVVCANHSDWMDAVILWTQTPNVRIMAKAELFKIPVWGWFIKKAGAFPIKRAQKDFASIYHAVKVVSLEKDNLVIFPEGTRRAKIKKVKPKIGAVYIALTADAPIIPVYIQEKKKMFSKVKVIYGEEYKINIDKESSKDKKVLNDLTTELMDKIYRLGKK